MGIGFSAVPGQVRIGTRTPAGIALGDTKIWPIATRSFTHSYSIMTGTSGGITGYWDGNAGTITDATYTLPNGRSARIRQTMQVGNMLRFLLNQSGLGTGDGDQFPTDIAVTLGGRVSHWGRPTAASSAGQGIYRDYALLSGVRPFRGAGEEMDITITY